MISWDCRYVGRQPQGRAWGGGEQAVRSDWEARRLLEALHLPVSTDPDRVPGLCRELDPGCEADEVGVQSRDCTRHIAWVRNWKGIHSTRDRLGSPAWWLVMSANQPVNVWEEGEYDPCVSACFPLFRNRHSRRFPDREAALPWDRDGPQAMRRQSGEKGSEGEGETRKEKLEAGRAGLAPPTQFAGAAWGDLRPRPFPSPLDEQGAIVRRAPFECVRTKVPRNFQSVCEAPRASWPRPGTQIFGQGQTHAGSHQRLRQRAPTCSCRHSVSIEKPVVGRAI